MAKRGAARSEPLQTWDEYLSERYGDKALFTLEEVCGILGCSKPTLYAMIGSGQFEIRRVGSSPRVTRLSLLEYLKSNPPK